MNERVEWCVLRVIKDGKIEYHSEGAQKRFGKSRAEEMAKTLGAPWVVNHFYTLVPPAAHEQWLSGLPPVARQAYHTAEAAEMEGPTLQHIREQIEELK